jgi:hypothetical protein
VYGMRDPRIPSILLLLAQKTDSAVVLELARSALPLTRCKLRQAAELLGMAPHSEMHRGRSSKVNWRTDLGQVF